MTAAVADTVSDIFDVVGGMDRNMAVLAGLRAEAIGQAINWSSVLEPDSSSHGSKELRQRSLRAELALVLRIPERTAEAMLVVSEMLTRKLPATLTTLKTGAITYRHAQIMVDQTLGMEPDDRALLEKQSLPFAKRLTAAKFERKLRALREAVNPETIADRRAKGVNDRELRYEPAPDGMAWLSAYLPAEIALGTFNRMTAIAKSLQSKTETRTLTQLRTDVFCDLLTDGEPTTGTRGLRPKVFVTVPVLTLLGQTETPGTLDGYGPIDPDTARTLAGHAPSFTRILTHPETGAILSVGRASYTVPSDLKTWLQVRDSTCRFPGCSRHASQCEIDHTDNWHYGGTTRHDNLAHLCKSHHTLKHNTPWKVTNTDGGGGTLTWTSPSGRSYTTEPELTIRT